MDAKWIRFDKVPNEGAKTSIHNIFNKEHGSFLGQIKWNTGWRKYCFFPAANCVFETDCLADICKFLNKLMLDRKIEKQNESRITRG